MSREDPHFRLRIPEDVKARIEAAALANSRSITSEIVARLRQSFDVENEASDLVRQQRELIAEQGRMLKQSMTMLEALAGAYEILRGNPDEPHA